jgi:hypothetical protein
VLVGSPWAGASLAGNVISTALLTFLLLSLFFLVRVTARLKLVVNIRSHLRVTE